MTTRRFFWLFFLIEIMFIVTGFAAVVNRANDGMYFSLLAIFLGAFFILIIMMVYDTTVRTRRSR